MSILKPTWAKRTIARAKRQRSADGTSIGDHKPKLTQSEIISKTLDGEKSNPSWMALREEVEQSILKESLENENRICQKLIDARYETIKKQIRDKSLKRIKTKTKLTDEQVMYARTMIKHSTMKDLAVELGCSWKTLENAVKGLTFQHLNASVKPQC